MTFTVEDMNAAIHDNKGQPIVPPVQAVWIGFDKRGLPTHDITSIECVAKAAEYDGDPGRNTYEIGTINGRYLYAPRSLGATQNRNGWIQCTAAQFETYVKALRTGMDFPLKDLKNELRLQ